MYTQITYYSILQYTNDHSYRWGLSLTVAGPSGSHLLCNPLQSTP